MTAALAHGVSGGPLAGLVKLVAGFPVRWPADPSVTQKILQASSDRRTRRPPGGVIVTGAAWSFRRRNTHMRKFIISIVAPATLASALLMVAGGWEPAEAADAVIRRCNNRHAACHERCLRVFDTAARREACGNRCVDAYLACSNRGYTPKGTGKAEQPPRGGASTDPKTPPRGPAAGTRAPLSGTVQQPPKSAPSGTILKGGGRR